MAQNRVTIADLAREAGVNKSAVSRALSGKPGVSEMTRARVLELAEAHQWRPNHTARALSRSQSGAIGWVLRRTPKISTIDPYFMDLLIGIQMQLSGTPYNLVLKLVDTVEDELRIYEEWDAEWRVDGVLLADLEVDDPRIALLRARDIPTAAIAAPSEDDPRSARPDACVSAHDAAGVDAIIRHLRDTGHRRVGWIAGPPAFVAARCRIEALDGWRPEFDTIETAHASLNPSAIALQAVALQRDHALTALVVDNELAAIETVAKLRAGGLTVPGEVSVVSWLGSDLCLLSDPPLTSLEHDVAGLGRLWASALLAATYDDAPSPPPTIGGPVLHVRSSTA
jgi:DNA-binding LacI/PurR family transcriptional regulator